MLKFKRPDGKTGADVANVAINGSGGDIAGGSAISKKREPAIDFYDFDGLLTPEDRAIRDKVRHFADTEITPIIADYWERDETPMQLLPKLAALNIAGGSIKGYGCPGLSVLATGLAGMEMTRGDGSVSTLFGVHSGLAMYALTPLRLTSVACWQWSHLVLLPLVLVRLRGSNEFTAPCFRTSRLLAMAVCACCVCAVVFGLFSREVT